ncbi:MAG: hypothetical protein J0I06_22355 [Planctomycetes bacterium]|nr:hypothetical protein [Planctomycetota bacterium]
MAAGRGERRAFEFDGHTFWWPTGLNPDDMLAACLLIFLDLASRARRGDALAAELLRNSPISVLRAADGRAYWQKGQPDEEPRPPEPGVRDGTPREHGSDPGSGGEAVPGNADEALAASTAAGRPQRSRRLAWVAAAGILAALAVGTFSLIATRSRGAEPPKVGPGVPDSRSAPGKSHSPGGLRGEDKP